MEVFCTLFDISSGSTLFAKVSIRGFRERSGSVVEYSRPRGHGFEPHRRHCVVVLEQDKFILAYSTGSTQEDPSLFS